MAASAAEGASASGELQAQPEALRGIVPRLEALLGERHAAAEKAASGAGSGQPGPDRAGASGGGVREARGSA